MPLPADDADVAPSITVTNSGCEAARRFYCIRVGKPWGIDRANNRKTSSGRAGACLARELTKIHEEWLRGSLSEILAILRSRALIRGEITLMVDRGTAESASPKPCFPESIARHLEEEMQQTHASRKDALKAIARQRGISRRDAYRQLVGEKQ